MSNETDPIAKMAQELAAFDMPQANYTGSVEKATILARYEAAKGMLETGQKIVRQLTDENLLLKTQLRAAARIIERHEKNTRSSENKLLEIDMAWFQWSGLSTWKKFWSTGSVLQSIREILDRGD